ncbi:hypothetical protein J3R30DRAFT_3704085 [Lentinula aciculospora]|uniref:Uncharacterized protein n=1 Tax=Lentinula aciculospora TaxID=153920 RepID=A0A9W9AAN0_9AGAR|nr:hypothetical protein J3R30DRAFT_3704085 [Lentinula aciculospora]
MSSVKDTELCEQNLDPFSDSIPLQSLLSHHSPISTPSPSKPPVDSSETTRIISLICLAVSTFIGLLCIASGIYIAVANRDIYNVVLPPTWPGGPPTYNVLPGMVALFPDASHRVVLPELMRLAFTIVYTFCDESIGFIHSVTQRSTLATHSTQSSQGFTIQRRRRALQFNTNLRFFTAPRDENIGTFHPNGTLCNAVMALLHILAYSSLSLSKLTFTATICSENLGPNRCQDGGWESFCVSAIPILALGVSIVLQASIALAGIHCTRILTWNSSPLLSLAAILREGQVTRVPGRCMCGVLDIKGSTTDRHPKKPSPIQPSAWKSHRGIRRIIRALWVSVLICGAWGGIIVAAWHKDTQSVSNLDTPGLESWAFIPTNNSNAFVFGPSFTGSPLSPSSWIICYVALIVAQGALAFALHCSEMIVNVLRDEHIWRLAVSKNGTKPANPILGVFNFWPTNVLRLAKFFLHWVFGFCLTLQGTIAYLGDPEDPHDDTFDTQSSLQVIMRSVQTWYLMFFLALFCMFVTILALHHPRGPQPAAYGHIQTLANLIDDWAPDTTIWWGHKEGEGTYDEGGETGSEEDRDRDRKVVHHAGTSDSPLPPVDLGYTYA